MEPFDRQKKGQDGTLTWVNNDGGDTTDYVDNVDSKGNVTSTDVYDVKTETVNCDDFEQSASIKTPGE